MCRCKTAAWLGLLVGLCGISWSLGVARAAESTSADAPAPEAKVTQRAERSWGEVEGDAGLGFLGSDMFTTLQVGFDLQEGGFTLGLAARLRLRVVDRGSEREGLGVRREDWDEPSDFAYMLRYASYRRRVHGVALGFTIGELSGYEMGNGSLVRDYSSALDLDHPHSGFATRIAGRRWQVDFLLDDFVAPEFVAARVGMTALHRGPHALLVGASGLLDFQIPTAVSLDTEGARRVDRHRNLVAQRGLFGAVGVDVAYRVGDPDKDQLKIYVDGNLLVPDRQSADPALGLHVGASFAVHPFQSKLRLFGGLEYRRLGPGYLPSWVDLLYDVQRLQFALTDRSVAALAAQGDGAPTKLGALAAGLAPAGDAWRGELGIRVAPWVEAAAHYDHRPGISGGALGARVSVFVGKHVVAAGRLERFGFVRSDDLGRSSGLLVVAEARYRPMRNLYVLAQYSRLMHLRDSGLYRPLDQLNVAVGGAWGY